MSDLVLFNSAIPVSNANSKVPDKTNRIKHLSPMQTEKSQPGGQWIVPETRFTCIGDR